MLELIKAVFESAMRAAIRFFDNRFVKSNDIDYFKMELARQQNDYQKVLDYILAPKTITAEIPDDEDRQPLNNGYKPWHVKRRELEKESLERAGRLVKEARQAMESAKSTEQLESELLNGTD